MIWFAKTDHRARIPRPPAPGGHRLAILAPYRGPGTGQPGSVRRGQVLAGAELETSPTAEDGCEPPAPRDRGGFRRVESGKPTRIIDAWAGVRTLSGNYGSARPGVWVCKLLSGMKMMRLKRLVRVATALASGSIMLQFGGCSSSDAFDFIQTILLGITAAGSWAILQNV